MPSLRENIQTDIRTNGRGATSLMLISYRIAADLHDSSRYSRAARVLRNFMYKAFMLVHRAGSFFTGCYLPPTARIGQNVLFPHSMHGIFISQSAVVEDHVTIFQHVTIGSDRYSRNPARHGAPHIGSHAVLGAGAKVIGRVRVGRGSMVGAGAVVTQDVPDHTTAVMGSLRLIPRPDETGTDESP